MAHGSDAAAPGTRQPGQLGAWAPYYDLVMAVLTLGRERALRRLEVELSTAAPGDAVLEVGCGTGSLALAMARHVGPGGRVHGVDIAPEMIRVAERKNARAGRPVDFRVAGIDALPFPDGTIDVVACSFMIFHMPDDVRRRGLAEISRVLRDGGTLLVVESATTGLDDLGRSLVEAGFAQPVIGARKVAAAAPSVHYLRATARPDARPPRPA